MTGPIDLAQLAARRLADASVPAECMRDARREQASIELVAAAIREREARSRRRRWIGPGLVAAVAASVALGIGLGKRAVVSTKSVADDPARVTSTVDTLVGTARVLGGPRDGTAKVGESIEVGDELIAPLGARLEFSLSTGTHVAVEDGGDLAVLEQDHTQVFRLVGGGMRARVHKLAEGERFVVRTRDAEVEVRGTSFRVAIAPPNDACSAVSSTRVEVEEGVVTVRSGAGEARVRAGESWPAECFDHPASAAPSSVTAMPEPSEAAGELPPSAPSVASASQRALHRGARSTLGAENDLYATAVAAKEAGDTASAVSLFERLARDYPGSPLAENAAAERMRLLDAKRRPEAARAAKEYLARYPSGFAHKDAEAILARGQGSP